jgi:ABC-type phosphate transport system substrate-binding protein
MKKWKLRSLVCVVAAGALYAPAFAAPGSAYAACAGANIEGNGASVEANAHKEVWEPTFNAKCAGPPATEQVKYVSTSSSKGLESWGVLNNSNFKGFGPTNAFVAVDDPPNSSQESEILAKQEPVSGAKVLSIPVLQFAVTLPIHLPEGCTATSGKGKAELHRLVLDDTQLQAIFAHTITTWAQLVEKANDYNEDKLVGATCDASAPIIRVVRKEGAGATAVLEKSLFEINKNAVDDSQTWEQLAENPENIEWPDEAEDLIRAEKGIPLAESVAANAGSIGYVNLSEVRQVAAFTPAGGGGEGSAIFWPELQNSGKKFQDPSTDLESNTPASANCEAEDYISLNGKGTQGKFPPASTEDVWNEVTANKTEKKSYPLCGFAYVLSLTDFANFASTSEAEVTSVQGYLGFVVSAEGQALLKGHDFLGLPTAKSAKGNVLDIAEAGVGKIAF